MASEGAKDMTKGARDGDSLAWALLYRAVRPAILPAPHSQPPGGVSSRNFRTFFKTAAVVRSKKAKFPTGKKRMRGNLKSANIRLLGLLLLFLITASGVFAFHAEKSHQGKPAVSVETALKAIDFASKNDISIDSEFSANLRQSINFNRNRYYSPALGRFVSKDPIGFLGGDNLWLYCDNNPIIFVDPYGWTRGERGQTGGGWGTKPNPEKKCREYNPPNPRFVECKDNQTGKWVRKPRPSSMPYRPPETQKCQAEQYPPPQPLAPGECQKTKKLILFLTASGYVAYKIVEFIVCPALVPLTP